MRRAANFMLIFAIISSFFFSCNEEPPVRKRTTQNIIVVIIDGARYSETWGDSTRSNIPNLFKLSEYGIVNTRFYNNGPTYTLAGHVGVTTGIYQEINNAGLELPLKPSFIQKYNFFTLSEKERSWIVGSKDKLEVLANTRDSVYYNRNSPATDCGINGLGTGNRDDSITFKALMKTLSSKYPRLLLVNFSGPDYYGHANNWSKYLESIRQADEYIYKLWMFIRTDSFYKDKTALFVTNDHGRHLDGVADGFVSHGDGCEGCRHLFFYAFGPDFKNGIVMDNQRELIDIPATIYNMLKLDDNQTQGKVMEELFR